MDKPAMASVFRLRNTPATILGVRSTGQGQSDPVLGTRPLGRAIEFVANAYPDFDIQTAGIMYGDRFAARLSSREVMALWTEYGRSWLEG